MVNFKGINSAILAPSTTRNSGNCKIYLLRSMCCVCSKYSHCSCFMILPLNRTKLFNFKKS